MVAFAVTNELFELPFNRPGGFRRQPVDEKRPLQMVKFMLDTPPEQTAAFALDPLTIERLRPKHHRSRTNHRRKKIRQFPD